MKKPHEIFAALQEKLPEGFELQFKNRGSIAHVSCRGERLLCYLLRVKNAQLYVEYSEGASSSSEPTTIEEAASRISKSVWIGDNKNIWRQQIKDMLETTWFAQPKGIKLGFYNNHIRLRSPKQMENFNCFSIINATRGAEICRAGFVNKLPSWRSANMPAWYFIAENDLRRFYEFDETKDAVEQHMQTYRQSLIAELSEIEERFKHIKETLDCWQQFKK